MNLSFLFAGAAEDLPGWKRRMFPAFPAWEKREFLLPAERLHLSGCRTSGRNCRQAQAPRRILNRPMTAQRKERRMGFPVPVHRNPPGGRTSGRICRQAQAPRRILNRPMTARQKGHRIGFPFQARANRQECRKSGRIYHRLPTARRSYCISRGSLFFIFFAIG